MTATVEGFCQDHADEQAGSSQHPESRMSLETANRSRKACIQRLRSQGSDEALVRFLAVETTASKLSLEELAKEELRVARQVRAFCWPASLGTRHMLLQHPEKELSFKNRVSIDFSIKCQAMATEQLF